MKKNILKHVPGLLVMLFGSGSFFMVTILIKNYGVKEDLKSWSYVSSYLAIFSPFLFMGAEQMIVRFGGKNNDKLELPRSVAVGILIAGLFSIGLSVFFLNGQIFDYKINNIKLTAILATLMLLTISYQLERFSQSGLSGQLVNNSWKIILLFVLALNFAIGNNWSIVDVILISLVGATLLVVVFSKALKAIVLVSSIQFKEEIKFYIPYFLSLLFMTIISVYDRLLFEHSEEGYNISFEDFFLLIAMYIMPFSILSAYVAYILVPIFKISNKSGIVRIHVWRIALVSLVAAIIWVLVIKVLGKNIGLIDVDYYSLLCIVMIIVVRMIYSVLSSAVGVLGSARKINIANAMCFIVLAFFSYVVVKYSNDVREIFYAVFFMWCMRCMSFYFVIKGSW